MSKKILLTERQLIFVTELIRNTIEEELKYGKLDEVGAREIIKGTMDFAKSIFYQGLEEKETFLNSNQVGTFEEEIKKFQSLIAEEFSENKDSLKKIIENYKRLINNFDIFFEDRTEFNLSGHASKSDAESDAEEYLLEMKAAEDLLESYYEKLQEFLRVQDKQKFRRISFELYSRLYKPLEENISTINMDIKGNELSHMNPEQVGYLKDTSYSAVLIEQKIKKINREINMFYERQDVGASTTSPT